MNCSEIHNGLSSYHDGELPPDEAVQLAEHVADCSDCAAELAALEQLSTMAERLVSPTVPEHLWEELQSKIRAPSELHLAAPQTASRLTLNKHFAIAATILVVIGIGVVAKQVWTSHDTTHLAANLDSFLEDFAHTPHEAQKLLLANYKGRQITLDEAADELGYEPKAAQGLPQDWSVEKAYLLTMPCCGCTQVICRNQQGRSIAIFEHDVEQPVSFGDHRAAKCRCQDVPTSAMQVGDGIAASWREGDRHITIVGAKDLDEVSQFVAQFRK